MAQSIVMRSFAAGEIAPALAARADLGQYRAGLRACRNCWVRPQGGVMNRPGTRYVAAAKIAGSAARLIPFIFEAADQTYVIEAGAGYFRFFWHGAAVSAGSPAAWSGATAYVVGDLVLEGGVNYYCILAHTNQQPPNATYWYALPSSGVYEIPSPYTAADVPDLHWTQSADVLTLTHASYAPRELRRVAATNWQLATVTTEPGIDPPTNLSGTAATAGTKTLRYVVTAAKSDTYEESYASAVLTITDAETPTVDAPQPLTWDAVAGAAEYCVHADPFGNGVFGYIGTAIGTTFNDPGLAPDFTVTPPVARTLFDAPGTYPAVVAYYQQRRVFARSSDEPETVWASRVGAYANFSISTPLRDDDAVTFVIASKHLNPVAHLVPLKRLVVLSDAGEWLIRGDEDGVLRPISINADQVGYVGADTRLRPVVIGNRLLYAQALGTVLRDLGFELDPDSLAGRDLTVYARHLFEGYSLVDLAFAHVPHSIVWAVRSDGTLLALTYVREQEVLAWSRHDTGASGAFEQVVVVPDSTSGEDVVYVLVRRTIDGSTVRYIERLESRYIGTLADDAFFVDAGLTYDGAPATVITGLDHLEGEVVAVLGDGVVVFDGDPDAAEAATFTVTGGQITLPAARSVVHVGLAIRYPEIELLDLDIEGTAVRDARKAITSVSALVLATAPTFQAGPDSSNLVAMTLEPWQPASSSMTGLLELPISSEWAEYGRVLIRHTDPLPFEILGLVPRVEVGA